MILEHNSSKVKLESKDQRNPEVRKFRDAATVSLPEIEKMGDLWMKLGTKKGFGWAT